MYELVFQLAALLVRGEVLDAGRFTAANGLLVDWLAPLEFHAHYRDLETVLLARVFLQIVGESRVRELLRSRRVNQQAATKTVTRRDHAIVESPGRYASREGSVDVDVRAGAERQAGPALRPCR